MALQAWLLRLMGPWVDPDPDGVGFDRTHGTETCWLDLGNYEPTPLRVAEEALDALPVSPAGRTFVDLGSGKGRVVLLASRRGFERVVGIEHRSTLQAIAERNREAFERSMGAGSPIHLLTGDAAYHPLPEGPLVVWLFNPFGAEVLGPVLSRLRDREVHVIYVVPTQLALVESQGFRTVAQGGSGDWPWRILTR